MKQCNRCLKIKELNSFWKRKDSSDGLCYSCKECFNIATSKAVYKAAKKEKHHNDPRKEMIRSAKIRAKKKGLEFNLTIDDIKIPSLCPVLNIPIFVSHDKPMSNSPTLDRINNNKGYTKENVVVVSFRANTLKSSATIEEIKLILRFYESLVS